jgi:ribonucleoside-diphosphate reductase alpha chain
MDFRTGDDAAMGLENDELAIEAVAPAATGKRTAVTMDKADTGSDELVANEAAAVMAEALKAAATAPKGEDSKKIADRRFDVVTDAARDALLTEFGKETLTDRYLLPG